MTRLLAAITWGRIQLVEGSETVRFGSDKNQPEVTMEVLHPRFYSAVLLGGSVGVTNTKSASSVTTSSGEINSDVP